MDLRNIDRTVAIGIVSSVASLTIGSVAGYLVAKRRLESKYEEIAQQEIAEARRRLKMFYKREEFAKPPIKGEPDDEEGEDQLLILEETVTTLLNQYDPSQQFGSDNHYPSTNGKPLGKDIPVQKRNVFEEPIMSDGEEDAEEQFPAYGPRVPGKPYVISSAEFNADDRGYRQITLTYYSDGALVEEGDRNEELNIVEDLIGEESLQYFGQDPDDPSTIHVRNDHLRVDYEVIYDERRFGQDMLGLRDDSEFMQQVQQLRRPRVTPNVGPRERFSHYRPGGVVGAAGE